MYTTTASEIREIITPIINILLIYHIVYIVQPTTDTEIKSNLNLRI